MSETQEEPFMASIPCFEGIMVSSETLRHEANQSVSIWLKKEGSGLNYPKEQFLEPRTLIQELKPNYIYNFPGPKIAKAYWIRLEYVQYFGRINTRCLFRNSGVYKHIPSWTRALERKKKRKEHSLRLPRYCVGTVSLGRCKLKPVRKHLSQANQ